MKITLNVALGIGAGIINCIVWYIVAKSLGFYSIAIEQYRYITTLILLLIGIFTSVYFKRKQDGGFIEFKDAVKYGIVYSIVLAVFLAVFNYLYYSVIVPDALDYFISEAKKTMIAEKLKEDEILKNVEVVKNYFGSFRMLMSTVIMGVILSLATGATLRKKNPALPFSEN